MIDADAQKRKVTPSNVTDFEREQLRFFLAREDIAATLAELNPSLAWLPVLAQLKVLGKGTQLVPWIARNFSDPGAVKDVVENIHFFNNETAEFLEYRMNQQVTELPNYLLESWRLIIRHLRDSKQGLSRSDWFDIAPRLKRGENSPELLERLVNVLRPKLRIGKRLSWRDNGDGTPPTQPFDLMSIDYEIEEGATEQEVISAWPVGASAQTDADLLRLLTISLTAALRDATHAGVESPNGYSISDGDVPSVAKHPQNAYHTGFLAIVRVIAEVWSRLAKKDGPSALRLVYEWASSEYRLVRRLALYAIADPVAPGILVGEILRALPQGELFLTNSSVEVHRLIRARWSDIPSEQRRLLEQKIISGPPLDWYRDGSEKHMHVDRAVYDLLGDMERSKLNISADAKQKLAEIEGRWPQWRLRDPEQAGFRTWMSVGNRSTGGSDEVAELSENQLASIISDAEVELNASASENFQSLIKKNTVWALNSLEAAAQHGSWAEQVWKPFLLSPKGLEDTDSNARISRLLIQWPENTFGRIASTAAWWLKEKFPLLPDQLLWTLWDRVELFARLEGIPSRQREADEVHRSQWVRDLFSDALNQPPGWLAEILIKKAPVDETDGNELSSDLRTRFDKLMSGADDFGQLARVRVAADVSFLFERAPEWTTKKVVPLFFWSSGDAAAAWSARKYASFIGSPKLMMLLKQPFLEIFTRPDVPDEDVRVFSEWLVVMMVVNRSREADYPITPLEARSVLRQVGTDGLSSVGHHLAIEMESAKPDEKLTRWRNVIGPVFQSVWPLDAELQSPQLTFKLVQLLRATGEAFPEAADVVTPFVKPEDIRSRTSIYSLSDADDVLYRSAPEKMLDLLAAIVGDAPARSVFALGKALERIRAHAPQLVDLRKFQKLATAAATP